MAAILRQALPQLRRAAAVPKGVRQMSGHSIEEEIKEMNKWRTISYAAVPGVILLTVYTLATATHHHSDEKIPFSYLHMRNKQWPWGGDLGLFESSPKKAHH